MINSDCSRRKLPDELLKFYRIQFPEMRMYKRVDEYEALEKYLDAYKTRPAEDALNSEWPFANEIGGAPPLEVSWEVHDGMQTVTKTLYPPCTKVDREADYPRAWAGFEERYGNGN